MISKTAKQLTTFLTLLTQIDTDSAEDSSKKNLNQNFDHWKKNLI